MSFQFGNMGPSDRAWAAKAQEEETAALSNLRSSAEKWAAALTSALGVVGLAALIKGPESFKGLTDAPRHRAEALFFVAALAALIATVLANFAAQQNAAKILGHSGSAYKQWAQDQIETWRTVLSASRWLAALAVACVLGSAAFLWFGENEPSTPTVIDASGSAICGDAAGDATTVTAAGASYVLRCRR
jgi:hypothetical protein